MARGHSSEVEVRGALGAWRKSGLPLERFAKQRGIVSQRLRWWRLKFAAAEKATVVSATPALLPPGSTAPERAQFRMSRLGQPCTRGARSTERLPFFESLATTCWSGLLPNLPHAAFNVTVRVFDE